jgi:hypothetical protein
MTLLAGFIIAVTLPHPTEKRYIFRSVVACVDGKEILLLRIER